MSQQNHNLTIKLYKNFEQFLEEATDNCTFILLF